MSSSKIQRERDDKNMKICQFWSREFMPLGRRYEERVQKFAFFAQNYRTRIKGRIILDCINHSSNSPPSPIFTKGVEKGEVGLKGEIVQKGSLLSDEIFIKRTKIFLMLSSLFFLNSQNQFCEIYKIKAPFSLAEANSYILIS